jgi:hypothetical protein
VEGFNQPFVKGHNFGSWMDTVLMGKINPGGWVAINCVPTAAHTIWGVWAGRILISSKDRFDKVKIVGTAGLIGIAMGYGMDLKNQVDSTQTCRYYNAAQRFPRPSPPSGPR